MINRAIIAGNLTRDARLAQTSSGTSIAEFSVAVNERRKNQNGEWEEQASFFDCKLFGTRADALAPYLTRGTKVAVEGRLSQRTWENKEGQRHSKVEILVDGLEFMSRREQQSKQQVYDDMPF